MSDLPSDQQDNWTTRNCDLDFLDPNTNHDRILVVEGQKFHVMSEFLSFSSEFFEGLFNKDSGFKEANEKEIEIGEVTAHDFKEFLRTIYPHSTKITAKNYRSIFNLANRFLAGPVVQKCRYFIMKNFDKLDAIDVLEVAFQYNMDDVKAEVATFLREDTNITCSGCEEFRCGSCLEHPFYDCHTHIDKNSSYINDNVKRIEALPAEVQAFILHVLINPTMYRT